MSDATLSIELEQAIAAMTTQVNAAKELVVRTTEDIILLDSRLDAHDTIFPTKADINHSHALIDIGFPSNFPVTFSDSLTLNSSTSLATSKAVKLVNDKFATKADLVAGKVPNSQLPSYVDDVLTYATRTAFPLTGESDKIYIDETTNKTYRWTGSTYVIIGSDLALGETYSTAYRGDRGKIAYDHSLEPHLALGVTSTTAYRGDLGAIAYTHSQQAHLQLGETSTTAYRGDRGVIAYNHSVSDHLLETDNASITGTWTFTKVVTSAIGFTVSSDERLKKNIRGITNPIDKLMEINGVSYQLNDDDTDLTYAGVIAQEVERSLPEAVVTDPKSGMKSVNYNALIALLIESVKELKRENTQLRHYIEANI